MTEARKPTGDFVDLVFGEVTIRFCGHYTPGDPGKHTMNNGDPGYPPTPSDFEWDAAWIGELEVTEMVNELMSLGDDALLTDRLVAEYEANLHHEQEEDFQEPLPDEDDSLGCRAGGTR